MKTHLVIDDIECSFDLSAPIDISIPLEFNGAQPNAYGVEAATAKPCAAGELVGDTRQGGSCNFEEYTLIPHCNGTHTECVGHITHERIAVRDCLSDALVASLLVSIEPELSADTAEKYSMAMGGADRVITQRRIQAALEQLLEDGRSGFTGGLIVRTLPNASSKQARRYVDEIPPYFTDDAIRYIVEVGVRHLLVDIPSIDRLYDEGRLSNHRVFWKVESGSFELTEIARRHSTITELTYVPNNVRDGHYLLNLQIPPFVSDAAPSRPLLFRVIEN